MKAVASTRVPNVSKDRHAVRTTARGVENIQRLRLDTSVRSQLWALADPERERCAALVGVVRDDEGWLTDVLFLPNEAATNHSFRVALDPLHGRVRTLRAHSHSYSLDQWGLIGLAHGHPSGPLKPSPADRHFMSFGPLPWLIIGSHALVCFRSTAGRLVEIPIDNNDGLKGTRKSSLNNYV